MQSLSPEFQAYLSSLPSNLPEIQRVGEQIEEAKTAKIVLNILKEYAEGLKNGPEEHLQISNELSEQLSKEEKKISVLEREVEGFATGERLVSLTKGRPKAPVGRRPPTRIARLAGKLEKPSPETLEKAQPEGEEKAAPEGSVHKPPPGAGPRMLPTQGLKPLRHIDRTLSEQSIRKETPEAPLLRAVGRAVSDPIVSKGEGGEKKRPVPKRQEEGDLQPPSKKKKAV